MCVSTKEMSFFGDLICRPSSSCPRRSPFSAKARFACGRFAGAPLELTLPRFFPSRVVSRSICFVRSKRARTTSSSAPRFAAKRSTTASFSQHESSRQNQLFRPPFFSQITGSRARRTTRLALSFFTALSPPQAGRTPPWCVSAVATPSTCTSPVQVRYIYALAGAARLVSLKIVLLDPLYVSADPPAASFFRSLVARGVARRGGVHTPRGF